MYSMEQLERVMVLGSRKDILKALRTAGFRDCTKDKKYKNLSLILLFTSNKQEGNEHRSLDGKYLHKGYIFTEVPGAENSVFITVATNKINMQTGKNIIKHTDIYVKEVI